MLIVSMMVARIALRKLFVWKMVNGKSEVEGTWDPPVEIDFEGFSEEQVVKIRRLLRDECDSFSCDENDIDCAPDLKMKVNLENKDPVKKNLFFYSPTLVSRSKGLYL